MKPLTPIQMLLLVLVLVLAVLSGCLYKQNRAILTRNKELVIKNDSILSVNLQLNQRIEGASRSALR